MDSLSLDRTQVLSYCVALDLGREKPDVAGPKLAAALAELPPDRALLHKFRNPEQLQLRVSGWLAVDAVKGPAAYRRVWLPESPVPEQVFHQACQFHRDFQAGYREVVRAVLEGDSRALQRGLDLGLQLQQHMAWEEAEVYPSLSAFLGEERVARELGYEHQGLRAALKRWPDFLTSCLEGQATRKQVESFELDLLHLFEHHVEREEEAVFPILTRAVRAPQAGRPLRMNEVCPLDSCGRTEK